MGRKIDLQAAFEEYNVKYFGGRIFDVDVQWSKAKELTYRKERISGLSCVYANDYKPQEIYLDTFLKKKEWMWRLVLLHELNHIDLSMTYGDGFADHGIEFNEVMLRLAKAGAFVDIW
jgi:hypothetical protein